MGADPKAIVAAGGVVVVVAAGLEWQPTITMSRLRVMPRTSALARRFRTNDPPPIKFVFRFDWYDIKDTSASKK